ncbi:hypothetical protein [Hamadaea tsunoensis]|uniref:hypothetical protein n=1 Tax=Hamadaea tsunoensis TaxID=53368 RepID=UPI0003F8D192|nr:hypothetical protein [Hamadaea tsunoensis]
MSRPATDMSGRRAAPPSDTGSAPAVRGLAGLLVFLGFSAAGGGIAMLADLHGGRYLPSRWLDGLPLIDTFLAPSLVLLAGFGAGSLLTAYGVLRRPVWRWARPVERWTRHHWSWAAVQALGAGQLVWIGLELIYLPDLSWLQAAYGTTGLALLLLPWTGPVRRRLRTGMTVPGLPRAATGA